MASGAVAALGFAPHSGWAAVVGLGISDGRPRVLARERIELADPGLPGSKQPYHALETLPIGLAAERLAAFEARAEALAHGAIARVAEDLARGGRRVVGAGILDSAGRKGSALASILASHPLIHTADGEHFRKAIEAAAARCGFPVARVGARGLEAEAAAVLGMEPQALRRTVQELGREAGPPWAADQKAAAVLAWLVLRRRAPAGDGSAREKS